MNVSLLALSGAPGVRVLLSVELEDRVTSGESLDTWGIENR